MRIIPREHTDSQCVPVPPAWRLGVLVLVYIVVIVLLLAGYDLPTALACTTGAGLAASHVTGRLFGATPAAEEASL
ncbi:peptidoglycan/LPS O-acetylase OafA/YrhL [Streptomyces canus]|uniref:Peptidoglycan/LPS O-acetylase OafA/YrhL n=1 Tax=Streptomyces canus TaxID=58343 RepID=A0AAW8F4A7_9ACTN|nr:hypothetical protein [Streptomyces canus]MDQ0904618.1 peptidoglycan/LPS O-acetylase OafA/YrhL [Streptomyces canus]